LKLAAVQREMDENVLAIQLIAEGLDRLEERKPAKKG
jgi:hypothetical protein